MLSLGVIIWAYKARPQRKLPALAALAEPATGRRLLVDDGRFQVWSPAVPIS